MYKLLLSLIIIISFFSCSEESSEIVIEPPVDSPISSVYSLDTFFVENCQQHVISECSEDNDKANIRIRNLSLFEICNIEYSPFYTIFNFGSLMPGDTTCYIVMDRSYRYPASVVFQIRDTTIRHNALDIVGESLLPPGFYTYSISVLNVNNSEVLQGTLNLNERERISVENNSEACKNNFEINCPVSVDSKNQVNLRVINSSIFGFCSFKLTDENSNTIDFENIRAGESTCYIPIQIQDEVDYRINTFINEIPVGNNLFRLWPDKPSVEPGLYTLYVGISDLSERGLFTHLIKDK